MPRTTRIKSFPTDPPIHPSRVRLNLERKATEPAAKSRTTSADSGPPAPKEN